MNPDTAQLVKVTQERDALLAACLVLIKAATDAEDHWQNDRDSKVGKLLCAMIGQLPGYRAELDNAAQTIEAAKKRGLNLCSIICEVEPATEVKSAGECSRCKLPSVCLKTVQVRLPGKATSYSDVPVFWCGACRITQSGKWRNVPT